MRAALVMFPVVLVLACGSPAQAAMVPSPTGVHVWAQALCEALITYDANDGSATIVFHQENGLPCHTDTLVFWTVFPAGSCATTSWGDVYCASADPFDPSWDRSLEVSTGSFLAHDGPIQASGWVTQVS